MPDWQRVTAAAYAGIIAFMAAYVIVDYAAIPRLFYFPIERRVELAAKLSGVPMGYLGLWVWASHAGVAAAAATYAASRLKKTPLSDKLLGLGLAWTITATVFAAAYYGWHNNPFIG